MFRGYYTLENNQAAIGGWVARAGLKDLRLTFHSWVWMSLNPLVLLTLAAWLFVCCQGCHCNYQSGFKLGVTMTPKQ